MKLDCEIIDCEQGTPEWFAHRIGVITASKFSMLVTSKGEKSDSMTKLIITKACEIITQEKESTVISYDMHRGIELEPEAKSWFSILHGDVVKVGFCKKGHYGCSPDGVLSSGDAGLEIKCPKAETHLSYLRAGKLPTQYIQQVQGSMLVTGLKKWWFMSYHPKMKPLIVPVERNDEFCQKLLQAIDNAKQMIDDMVEEYKA
jgi:putative phage-type endonuclease